MNLSILSKWWLQGSAGSPSPGNCFLPLTWSIGVRVDYRSLLCSLAPSPWLCCGLAHSMLLIMSIRLSVYFFELWTRNWLCVIHFLILIFIDFIFLYQFQVQNKTEGKIQRCPLWLIQHMNSLPHYQCHSTRWHIFYQEWAYIGAS